MASEVDKHGQDQYLQFHNWLETALCAERQAFTLQLERRHSFLLLECIKDRGVGAATHSSANEGLANSDAWCTDNDLHKKEEPDEGLEGPYEPNLSLRVVARSSDLDGPNEEEEESIQEVDTSKSGASPIARSKTRNSTFEDLLGLSGGPEQARHSWNTIHFLYTMVTSSEFELTFAGLIILNAVVMALECQYHGLGLGFEVQYPHHHKTSEEAWPGMKVAFVVLNYSFGGIFTIELLAKIIGLRSAFVSDFWNVLDAIIVGGWLCDVLLGDLVELPIDPMLLRLMRLIKLLRLLKLVKSLHGIDPLFLMITALKGSFSVLVWAIVLMVVAQSMFAFLLNQMLVSYYLMPPSEDPQVIQQKKDVFRYFGTFSRAIFSTFEMTFGNWVPIARLLIDDVSEWLMLFSLFHKLTLGFAAIGVINGVFIQETFKVAACDDTLMLMQRNRQQKVHTKKMEGFFQAADRDGDGSLDEEEFLLILENKHVRTWLAAQEVNLIDDTDRKHLFALCSEGREGLTATDLVKGVSKLKGNARSLDLSVLMHQVVKLAADVERIAINSQTQEARLQRRSQKISTDASTSGDQATFNELQQVLLSARHLFRDMSRGPSGVGGFTKMKQDSKMLQL